MFKNPYFLAAQIFLVLSISELPASAHSHKIDDLDEHESMRFVHQYFSNPHSTFNAYEGFEVINLYYGNSRYSLQQAIQPINFYGFRATNFMADRYLDMQNIHAFFFQESYKLLSNLFTVRDEVRNINRDEYWAALIFYHFLKPRTIYHASPLPNIDRVITWLCNNTDEDIVWRIFNISQSITDDPEYASASAEIQSILSSDALTAPALVQSVFLGIPQSPEGVGTDRTSPQRVEDSDEDTLDYLEQQLKLQGLGDDPESPQS
jgi:hypothetical protein